ncbi:MAG: nucleotidyltransferase family protein [Clostridia bacterium]|nr:nucleotidyltransferase family protein [Clostridia bacterium]
MKRAGIVCEFNPFHTGHARLIEAARRLTGGEVVCVMSGCFVQRGEPAVMPPRGRAAAAVAAGAGCVFELPFPWSASSAAFFAAAAVKMLSGLGCDSLVFGSESADIGYLTEKASEPRRTAAAGEPTASALPRLMPNDVLAVEYIRAIKKTGAALEPVAIKREGSHLDEELPEDGSFPSSAAIRAALTAGNRPTGLTPGSLAELDGATERGDAPASAERLSRAVLAFFRTAPSGNVAECAECGGGVAGRLASAARKATGFSSMMSAASTKKYTDARLRRAVWFAMTGTAEADLKAAPAYARLLAVGQEGRKILSSDGISIPVVPRMRDLPGDPASRRQLELALRAEALFGLSLPVPAEAGRFIKESAEYICRAGDK